MLAFTALAALLTITPGADMALVTRTALLRGWGAAVVTAFGIVAGCLVWAVLSAAGIAAVVAASTTAFTVLKLAGAAYLIALGVMTLRGAGGFDPGADADPGASDAPAAGGRGGWRSAFALGFATNILNPKLAVFYTAVLPQFVGPGDPVLLRSVLLAGIHGLLGIVWLGAYARMVVAARATLARPRVRRVVQRVTGWALVAFGVRLAAASR